MIKIYHEEGDMLFTHVICIAAMFFMAGAFAGRISDNPNFLIVTAILILAAIFWGSWVAYKVMNPKVDIDSITEAEINERVDQKLKQIKDAL